MKCGVVVRLEYGGHGKGEKGDIENTEVSEVRK